MFLTLSSKFRHMVILLALFAVVLPAQTESSFSGGDGTEASPYQISTVTDLQQLATDVNNGIPYTGKYFKLTKNLDLSSVCDKDVNGKEASWTPIGTYVDETENNPFEGHFDGNDYTISNLYINSTSNYLGLFGYLRDGSISNLGVINSSVSSSYTSYVGGVCGYNTGTISNCYNSGNVTGDGWYFGGVCGYNTGTINNCYNSGNVSGEEFVGGVCGYNTGTISNSYNSANVSGTGDGIGAVGGVCGYNTDSISNSYNSGSVNGIVCVGGVCGYNDGGTISNCYNTGSVSSNDSHVGGVCGFNSGTISNCYNNGNVSGYNNSSWYTGGNTSGIDGFGGVCGFNSGTISNCYNSGNVSGTGYWYAAGGISGVGGVCGKNVGGTISNSYNSGNVSGIGYAVSDIGGVCGIIYKGKGIISNSYNSGKVIGIDEVGGVCGFIDSGTVSNSYYDKQISPIGGINGKDSTGAVGKLTTEIIGTGIFSDTNWVTADNMYPRLKGMDTTAVAIVSATPIFLANEETSLAVKSNFTVGTGNNVAWSSQQNKVSINGSAVTMVEKGNDTLVCTLGSVTRHIAITVTDTLTKIENIKINTASPSKYTLFPSIVTTGFYIDLGTKKDIVVIYNLDGKQMQTENVSGRQYIDISSYAQGLYIVKTSGKSWKITKQ